MMPVETGTSPGSRATPFFRYPSDNHDRFATIIPGQDHGAMGAPAPGPVRQFLISNAVFFFDIYLRHGIKLGPHVYAGQHMSMTDEGRPRRAP